MKIAYLYPALDTVGGADRVITEKANYLAEKCGYDVYLITAHQNNKPLYFPLSSKVIHVDLGVDFNKQYGHSLLKRSFIYMKLLREYKKKLTKLLFELKLDIVITTISRDIDFLYKLKDGSKKVAEAHIAKPYIRNIHLMLQTKGLYYIIGRIWTYKLEKAIKSFDALVVLTNRDAKSWIGVKTPHVIANSLPFYPEESSACENKKIISVGRLDEQKGYDMLIDAWEIVHKKEPEWVLTIYGSGVLHDQFSRSVKAKGLESSFILANPVKNIVDKYLESSIYVMSSRFEGFGMVLAEAMACGVPCVSFDCPHGPSDIIKDKVDGLIVKNGNIEQLADNILYMITHNEERKGMGIRAKENIKRYSPDVIMKNWTNLFEELTSK
ncbi:glycosyltransferase family 4 protein [Bacteroides sp. 214]|uniref:glycosyltransferase family 4 protein n=1 Tax=Bacteroides sp. 214 TaxID=2302935 RepID=UPI0013D17174|nr:glycosyltransferase family 4 protein [Bacteroides sp. 214]NDW12747.1 glycosyltransferase family 4 protein [Bacteroides sp. 214]